MKKLTRVITLAFILLFAFSAFGCAAQDQVLDLEAIKPWETVTHYERSEYKVEKYSLKVQGKEMVKDEVIAEGTFVSEIAMNVRQEDGSDVTTLTTSLSMQYNNSDKAIDKSGNTETDNRNKKDTMISTVDFYTAGLIPISSSKSFVLEPRPNEKPEDNRSYSYTADYKNHTASVTLHGNTKTISFPSNSIDNEQVYIVTRALKTTTPKGSGVFYMTNVLDCYLNPELGRYTMSTTTAEALTAFEVNPNLNAFIPAGEDGKYKVDCMETTIGINSQTPGPRIKMLITEPKVKFTVGSRTTSKILMQFTHSEFNVSAVSEKYRTVFTLNNYSIEK